MEAEELGFPPREPFAGAEVPGGPSVQGLEHATEALRQEASRWGARSPSVSFSSFVHTANCLLVHPSCRAACASAV